MEFKVGHVYENSYGTSYLIITDLRSYPGFNTDYCLIGIKLDKENLVANNQIFISFETFTSAGHISLDVRSSHDLNILSIGNSYKDYLQNLKDKELI